MAKASPLPYLLHGPAAPERPVVLSVPHAGRDYPAALLEATRLAARQLELLEDRHADRLCESAIDRGFSTIIATRARAWIDLNRHEREIDPDMIDPRPQGEALIRSSKVIGGLGLLPRRLRGNGDILRHKVSQACLDGRIEIDHRPYHRALAAMMRAARDRFGTAVLLDLHSMPPLADGAEIVIGDLFGRSAHARYSERIRQLAEARGFSVAMNNPYAGGHILGTQGQPNRGIHAIQLEIDRSLYLEADLRTPRQDLGGLDTLIAAIAEALADEAQAHHIAIAAE